MKTKTRKAVSKDKWVWMPHPGHFICSHMCRFSLNTRVGKYIVSTIGEYWPDRSVREIHAKIYDSQWLSENICLLGDNFDAAYMKHFGYEDIGYGRKYETMVFRAQKSKSKCCPWEMLSGEKDFSGYKTPEDAYEGHMKMCAKWAKKQ